MVSDPPRSSIESWTRLEALCRAIGINSKQSNWNVLQELAISGNTTGGLLPLGSFFKSKNNQILFECILRIAYDQGCDCVKSVVDNLFAGLLIVEDAAQRELEGENVVWKIVSGLRIRYHGISALGYEGEPLDEFFIQNSDEYFYTTTAVLAFVSSCCGERESICQIIDHLSQNCQQTINALPVVLSHTPAHLERLEEIKAFFQRRKCLLDSLKAKLS
jgi:hypothetical protein